MSFSRTERPLISPAVWLASALALIVTADTSAEAKRLATIAKKTYAHAALAPLPKQEPAKLRYYGGPKSPMFPE
jgi:hypothetical protein